MQVKYTLQKDLKETNDISVEGVFIQWCIDKQQ